MVNKSLSRAKGRLNRSKAEAQEREACDHQRARKLLKLHASGRSIMRYGHRKATRAEADDPCKA